MILGQRKSKLSLPAVNQYPVPPNATPQQKLAEKAANGQAKNPWAGVGGQQGGGGHQGQGNGHQGQHKPGGDHYGDIKHHGQGGGLGPGAGGSVNQHWGNYDPHKPGQKPPPQQGGPQVDPASPFQVSPFPRGAGQIPADDPYWTNVAQLLFNSQQSYNASNLQSTYAKHDQSTQLAQMAVGRYQQQQSDTGDAMRQGLAYSGYLGNLDAAHGGDYANSVSALDTNASRDEAGRQASRQALVEGFGLDVSGQQSAALQRLAQAQADRAHTGDPIITPRDIKRIRRMLNGGGKGHHGGGHHHGGN